MQPHDVSPLSMNGRSLSSNREPSHAKANTSISTVEVKPLSDPHSSTFADRWRRFWVRRFLNTWLAEILALTFSASCLVAIIIVLKVYERKSIPQIPFGLTLNAIISILATGSKSSLLLAVAGAISQLKWCWFTSKSRDLGDIQEFDDASRGPWGSLTLLFSAHFRSLASLGALITLLTLAYDPFVQQVLKYPVREISQASDDVSTGQALVFFPDVNTPAFGNALHAGIWSDEAAFVRDPSCPSGNCNWPIFKSVGWCTKCENVTTRIEVDDCPFEDLFDAKIKDLTCNITLDGTSSVRYAWGNASQELGYDSFDRYGLQNDSDLDILSHIVWQVHKSTSGRGPTVLGIENPALVVGYAQLWYLGDGQTWPNTTIRATVHHAEQCLITPCERTYNISTLNGELRAGVLEENYGISQLYDVPAVVDIHSPFQTEEVFCWQNEPGNLTWHYIREGELDGPQYGYTNPWLPPQQRRWVNVSSSGFCSLPDYQDDISNSLTGEGRMNVIANMPGSGQTAIWEFIQAYPYAESLQAPEYTSRALQKIMTSNLTTVLGNVAASMTKLALDLSNVTVHGNVSTSEVYVHAEWKWLVFPITLEALGMLLILSTVAVSHSQKARLWKSSVMPLLYHGLDESIAKDQRVPQDVFGMEELARKTKVRLNGPLLDDRLVLAA